MTSGAFWFSIAAIISFFAFCLMGPTYLVAAVGGALLCISVALMAFSLVASH